ncbi:hypothetical protein [Azospirillum sp. SYSU D00513]|uniref:hypothetical protein n=1 Tax=Azospirillum sp. SYSU D00513 TaxID=2812561 RepID=UPI001A96EA19|nr:hypothetical protein [Azospirillum sp. SYSU D00513]
MPDGNNEWGLLLKSTIESFKTLVKNRVRAGEALALDEYHYLIRDAVERTMPRHDNAIRQILESEASLWTRALEEGARTLSGAGSLVIRNALEETLIGRLGTLRREFAGQSSRLDIVLCQERLRAIEGITPSWRAYVPHLRSCFEAAMELDRAEDRLPNAFRERDAIEYIEQFLAEILPDSSSLVAVASILASDPDLYNSAPAREPSLRGTILKTFERVLAEVLTDLFTKYNRQIKEHGSD